MAVTSEEAIQNNMLEDLCKASGLVPEVSFCTGISESEDLQVLPSDLQGEPYCRMDSDGASQSDTSNLRQIDHQFVRVSILLHLRGSIQAALWVECRYSTVEDEPGSQRRTNLRLVPVTGKPMESISLDHCPVCDSHGVGSWREVAAGGIRYRLDRCRACGYCFVNPRPSFRFSERALRPTEQGRRSEGRPRSGIERIGQHTTSGFGIDQGMRRGFSRGSTHCYRNVTACWM